METKCWVEGVFLDRSLFNITNQQAIAEGVGSTEYKGRAAIDSGYIHQNYYQWVVPVLALEAILLLLPRVLWHLWENGVMSSLLKDTGKWIDSAR
jgi:Innexin